MKKHPQKRRKAPDYRKQRREETQINNESFQRLVEKVNKKNA